MFACLLVDSNGTLKKSSTSSESDYMGFNRRKSTRESHQKYFVLDANLFLLAVPDKVCAALARCEYIAL